MYRRGVHAGGADTFHNLPKACLLMGAGPLIRRLEYENAITAAEYIVIPFKLVAVAPRERVRLEHDKQATSRKMLFYRGDRAFGLVIRRSKAFEYLHAGMI